jgi:hypothetical protein
MHKAYQGMAYRYLTFLPHISDCAGGVVAGASSCALITIYLGLFVHFYSQTYKKPTSNNLNGIANGHGNGSSDRKAGSIHE